MYTMNIKIRFVFIIILMAFALLGLVGIQVYWIHSVITERTLEFEDNVNRSIRQITKQVEMEEYHAFENLLINASDLKDFLTPKVRNLNINYSTVFPNRQGTISVLQNVREESFTIPTSKLSSNYSDSLRIRNYIEYNRVYTNPLYNESTGISSNYSTRYGWQEDHGLRDNFRTVVSIVGDKTPIQNRIDPQRLTGIIDEILSENGINIPYQYGILTNGELSSVHSPEWSEDLIPYHSSLFVSEGGEVKYELVLRFPQEMNFVVRTMVPMIIATVLFIFIIMAVFSAAMYYMIKQKKVADMKNDFINNMTHEFKTPIATISIAADALNAERINSDPKKVEHYAGIIKQENRRMLTQVESVLRIARLERGQMELNKVPSDLNTLLEEALEHIELIVADRNGTVEERFEAENASATVDRMHLINIFLNILDNANKYSPGQPSITVRTYNTDDGKYWAVDISDKGMGMSKSNIKKIFDNFYRIPTGDVHNIKGHGLGLAYSKKIVELHGGTIEADSIPDKGSTFTVKLPLG